MSVAGRVVTGYSKPKIADYSATGGVISYSNGMTLAGSTFASASSKVTFTFLTPGDGQWCYGRVLCNGDQLVETGNSSDAESTYHSFTVTDATQIANLKQYGIELNDYYSGGLNGFSGLWILCE